MPLTLQTISAQEAAPLLSALARLRITVFREFPYLYDGNAEYEAEYLKTYLKSERSTFVVARNDEQIVGMSTAIPLPDETGEVKRPWLERGDDLSRIYYFGESVLLPAFRGQGIGVRFFEAREKAAQMLGFEYATFCAVIRPKNHPLQPGNYQPLHRFWENRGFQKLGGMICEMKWKEIGSEAERLNKLQFWGKALI